MTSSMQQFISHLVVVVAALAAIVALALTKNLTTVTLGAVLAVAGFGTAGVASTSVIGALAASTPAPSEPPKA